MAEHARDLIRRAEVTGDWNPVADWCENFDWSQAEEVPIAEFYREQAAAAQAASERDPADAPRGHSETVRSSRPTR